MDSPIKAARLRHALTIPSVANQLGINYKTYSANEACTYAAPLPSILKFFSALGETPSELREAYFSFQKEQRSTNGARLNLYTKQELSGDYELTQSPFEHFRDELQISRSGFSKQFCIQVGLLFRLERGAFVNLPTDLKVALTQGGLSKEVLEELDYRTSEFFEHVRSLKVG